MRAVFLTTPDLIGLHWCSVCKLVDPVVHQAARGEFTLSDLAAMVESGRAHAAIALDGDTPVLAMVFEFRHYPSRMLVNIIALGGRDLAGVAVTFWPQFLEWAKESGASGIEACTSPAMTRAIRALGFLHTYDLVRCDFGETT
jgi:hypothetical protein